MFFKITLYCSSLDHLCVCELQICTVLSSGHACRAWLKHGGCIWNTGRPVLQRRAVAQNVKLFHLWLQPLWVSHTMQ